jgi:hypothetical protein
MRVKLLLLLLSLLACGSARAQNSARGPLVYWHLSLSPDMQRGFGLAGGAACLFGKRHEIAMAYRAFSQPVDYEPADFHYGGKHGGELNKSFEGGQVTYAYALNARFWPGRLRYLLRGGLVIGRIGVPHNFRPRAQTSPWESNYDYDFDMRTYTGVILNPSVDIAPGRVIGMTLGPYAFFGERMNSAGIMIGAIIGRVGYLKWAPEARRIRGVVDGWR